MNDERQIEKGITIINASCPNQFYRHKMRLQSHEPKDYSDLGQARIFTQEYGDIVRWTTGTHFLVYNGQYWQESETAARKQLQMLTDIQYRESKDAVMEAKKEELKANKYGNGKMIEDAKKKLKHANDYFDFSISRRNSNRIKNALREAEPMVEIGLSELNRNPFLLNTPCGTVNLCTGRIQEHNPDDLITMMTAVAPNQTNREMFNAFLRRITCDDADLQKYLQEIVGMCAIGKVFTECLILCIGSGGNGKSTFWNLIYKVFGEYAVTMLSETLTERLFANNKTSNGSLRGKRFALYPELHDNVALDMGLVKLIASADPIAAEPKYKDQYTFIPTHTPVVYANELPAVKAVDQGSWDRLLLIPFNARIRGTKSDVRNYADELFEKCGGAVLAWIIDGAKRFIENGMKLTPPECVREIQDKYRQTNDWFFRFTQERCELGEGFKILSSDLYRGYETFCNQRRETIRSKVEFAKAYQAAGYQSKRSGQGVFISAIRLKLSEPQPVEIPTPFDSGEAL